MKIVPFVLLINICLLSCNKLTQKISEEGIPPSKLLYERNLDDTTIVFHNQVEIEIAENTPKWEWVKNVIKTGSITPMAYAKTVVDSSGNSYITNYIPTLNNSEDIFLAKYSSEGKLEWELMMGGKGRDSGHDLAIDKNGNIWLVGYFFKKAKFGTFTLIGDSDYNLFLVKVDPNGVCKNAYKVASDNDGFSYKNENIIGNGQLGGFSIFIRNSNEIILSGEFERRISFNNFQLTTDKRRSSFIAKINLLGECIWVIKAESNNGCYSSIAYNSTAGDSYFLSSCADTLFVGSKSMIANSSQNGDMLLAKISAAGNCDWIKRTDDNLDWETFDNSKQANVPNKSETFYLRVHRDSTKSINPKIRDNGIEVALVELNMKGEYLRFAPLGNGLEVPERAVWAYTTDIDNNIYVAGHYSGDTYFGTKKVIFSESKRQSGYIAKYSTNGYCEWVKVIPCYGKVLWPRSLIVKDNMLYVSGSYQVRADFDQFSIETKEANRDVHEIFLAKLKL